MKRMTLYIIAAVFFAAIGAYIGTKTMPQSAAVAPETLVLEQVLSQTLPDQHGQPQDLSKWKKQPLIINFWATWCAPCIAEMPELVALQKEIGTTQIIGIGIDSQANVAQFAEKLHIDYPLYVADTSMIKLLRELGNETGGLPFTLLVGADGLIKKVYVGQLKFDELRQDLASFHMM
jgi:thiol-disulfide isomerase/thioredoxin